jgi:hypothetical protein
MSTKSIPRVWCLTVCLVACSLAASRALAALTVQITVPGTDPATVQVQQPQTFQAAAYLNGQPVCWGVTWSWDFGDGTPLSSSNPTQHTFTSVASFIVTVTVTYAGQQAQDTVTMQVQEAQGDPGFTLIMVPPDDVVCDVWPVRMTAPGTNQYTGMGVKQVWKKQGDEQWVCYEPQPGGGFGLDCPLHFSAPVVTSPSRTWEGSWHTWTCQNVNTQLYVVLRCQGFPPYFLQTDKRTNTISSEPKNTVTKAWSGYATQPQLLRFDPGSADPELQDPVIHWNAIHRDWFGFQNNHFHYRVEVHDLSGNQIRLVADYQQNPGEGSLSHP